ncbi:MAG: electron transfer flavoprotein subunit alpha/FixB family protein [Ignavibacteriaceae bacterium]|nr:electron transfer flavoprotein subunit alpha/FixB family protein [Ignavibacteriaceae bacterium]MCW8812509.1 electron transfer flavoprotein subunit alpha/FixB family protein [Chlorobium sp.]MCW9094967.1 electron transfer flavoprotein subunit alpha/FixB family protein [Ignavibacteriaceae bacterium]
MANKILAVLEQREGSLKRSAFEVVNKAANLAKELNTIAEAVVVGDAINNLNEISKYGIQKITHLKNSELANYSSSGYTEAISNLAKESDFDILILSNTALGKDLAPHLSIKLDAACVVDCIKISVSGNDIICTRPTYAGKALVDLKLLSNKKVITIRPNVFKAQVTENSNPPEIVVKDITSANLRSKVTEFKKAEGKLDVSEADIIVSGGRGMKGPENFHLIEELAETLGAAVGASRAVVDAGWRPHSEQVGQTGKTVSPTLYIACGISGAIQHLAGMSSSKFIVAINKDKDAPIFNVADYGITGDLFEILPVLTSEIKKVK